ncbi:DUF2914 domain-containing protein [Marinomonas rhizomae]|uniref:DUF2914 family protein n=1 Tax=Marinomonas rhizomae TaxID=491948 RepID=A0A366JAB3_9GAMM|nr:DUF2914 domain-containing protein [Marinomonas rhizomae]RBP83224.1 DUF2914 family protein [Marinomonas rhizomae]RNF72479.1 DUF2914 domain-containing protein [Marinomonas rhizomae]
MWQTLTRVVLAGILSFAMTLPAWAEGTVARAQFSTDVVDREPVDDIGSTVKVEYGEIQRVYFFTDLRDMSGSQVVHRWKLDGEDQADVGFDIGGDRWRVWSSKRLMPGFDGKWSVEVVQDGQVVETRTFDYVDEY